MLFLLLLSSCSKNGCTDQSAENYEPKATEDCGCCYFSAKGLGWYQKGFYDYLNSKGVTALKYFANGEQIGETSYTGDYRVSAPTFATNGSDYSFYHKGDWNVVILGLGADKSKTIEVNVTDQGGNTVWKGNVTFIAGKITAFELN